jgi:hypothetical protein
MRLLPRDYRAIGISEFQRCLERSPILGACIKTRPELRIKKVYSRPLTRSIGKLRGGLERVANAIDPEAVLPRVNFHLSIEVTGWPA